MTGCTQQDKSDLQIHQNKILRCCLNINYPLDIDTIEMHDMLDISMVDHHRIQQLLVLIKKECE